MAQNYYEALNLDKNATRDEIHRAYRDLARRYHPDRNSTDGAVRIMSAVNEAYAVLSDPARRAVYDQQRQAPTGDLDHVILCAARDTLCSRGWTLEADHDDTFTLRNGPREVAVALVPSVTARALARCAPKAGGFLAILTLRSDVETHKQAHPLVVIDVMRSQVVTGSFPDAVYRDLFRPLC